MGLSVRPTSAAGWTEAAGVVGPLGLHIECGMVWCGAVQQLLVVRLQHQWYLEGFCRVCSAGFPVAPGPSPPAALVLGPEPQ